MRALVVVWLAVASCVRAPAPLDVDALVARRGPVEARRELAIRVLDDPRDVQARLALAALAEQIGRPSEAIEQLEVVLRLGGPAGTRWHDDDRARLGRLLLARGRLRLSRGAASARADLERAANLSAKPTAGELARAELAVAMTAIRHADAKVRAKARATFAAHATPANGSATQESSWLGAREGASPAERGAFGAWLWTIGARREAYEHLAAWHAAAAVPRDEVLQSAYLRAVAWWSPLWLGEVPPPVAGDLVGPERCWFPGADCPPPRTEPSPLPPVGARTGEPRVDAAARYAATRFHGPFDAGDLAPIAAAYLREPTRADRWGRDLVAAVQDAAVAHAALGALFDALGDTPRARASWQGAVALSAEPLFVRGLAEATGRLGDGPAALVFATQAAAAWGDPAVVWNSVAAALLYASQYVDAMTAVRTALDLAGPDDLPRSLDLAIEISRKLGRTAQADAMMLQRAQLAPRDETGESDAIAALAAHRARSTASTVADMWVASRAHPRNLELRVALVDALDVDDPRRAAVAHELLELAGDEVSDRALEAAAALTGRPGERN